MRKSKEMTLLQSVGVCAGLAVGVVLLTACGPGEAATPPDVRSYLEGRVTVSAEVDSVQDYRGFEILVASQDSAGVDTLGYAVTDPDGAFTMEVRAEDQGIYPLLISRRGTVLKVDELVVVAGDSASFEVVLPTNRPLRIRSEENAAWTAYKNTKAQYNQSVYQLVQQGEGNAAAFEGRVGQAAAILWSLRETFPGTLAAGVAGAEAVLMIGGWDDSLLVARAWQIEPDNTSLVEVARAARRAQARLAGQEAALALVRDFQGRVGDDRRKAALQSEIVLAHMDSLEQAEALEAARVLRETYPQSSWAAWAEHAAYEIEYLLPGLPAPPFEVTTREGATLRLDSLRGQVVLLEFYAPGDGIFAKQVDARNALYEAAAGQGLVLLSLSLQPDPVLNEAFFEGRPLPGQHVWMDQETASDLARRYNVHVLPTRYLIDRDGRIAGKYVGDAFVPMQEDLASLLARDAAPSQ